MHARKDDPRQHLSTQIKMYGEMWLKMEKNNTTKVICLLFAKEYECTLSRVMFGYALKWDETTGVSDQGAPKTGNTLLSQNLIPLLRSLLFL